MSEITEVLMDKNWDYAELSKAAHAAGGPERYIAVIEEESRNAGHRDMAPWIGVALLGGIAIKTLSEKAWAYIKNKQAERNERIEQAKIELINEIRQHDKSCPGTENLSQASDITSESDDKGGDNDADVP